MASLGAIGGFLQGFTQTFQQMQEHKLRKRRAAVDEREAGNRTKLLNAQIGRMNQEADHQNQLEKQAQARIENSQQQLDLTRDKARVEMMQMSIDEITGGRPRDALTDGEFAQVKALEGSMQEIFGEFDAGVPGGGVIEGLQQGPAAPAPADSQGAQAGPVEFGSQQFGSFPSISPRTGEPAVEQQQTAHAAQAPDLRNEEEQVRDSAMVASQDALRNRGITFENFEGKKTHFVTDHGEGASLRNDPQIGPMLRTGGISLMTYADRDRMLKTNKENISEQMMEAAVNTAQSFNSNMMKVAVDQGFYSREEAEEFAENGSVEEKPMPIQIGQNEQGIPVIKVNNAGDPKSLSVISEGLNRLRVAGEVLGPELRQGLVDSFRLGASHDIQSGLISHPDVHDAGDGTYYINLYGEIPVNDYTNIASYMSETQSQASPSAKVVPLGVMRMPTDPEAVQDFDREYSEKIKEIPDLGVTKPDEESVNASVQDRGNAIVQTKYMVFDSTPTTKSAIKKIIQDVGDEGNADFVRNYKDGPVNPDLLDSMNELRKEVGLNPLNPNKFSKSRDQRLIDAQQRFKAGLPPPKLPGFEILPRSFPQIPQFESEKARRRRRALGKKAPTKGRTSVK